MPHSGAWIRLIGRNVLDTGETLVAGRIDEVYRAAQRHLQPGRLHGAGSVSMNDAAAQHFLYLCPEPHQHCWLRPGGQAITSWSPCAVRYAAYSARASGESGS
ncbi:Uncharacterised protein [Mycobacterium tuberculosis]|nr:Uncharacterised protein [Mycobacterium tuberculosis]